MEALAFGRRLHKLEEGTMTLWGGRLWALELIDKWGWGGKALLLLSACLKDFD